MKVTDFHKTPMGGYFIVGYKMMIKNINSKQDRFEAIINIRKILVTMMIN